MKKFNILLPLFFISFSIRTKVYSLNELNELMKKNSPQVKIEKTNINEINARVSGKKATNLPTISAIVGGERREVPSQEELNKSNVVGEIHADYNLYSFGKYKNEIDALKMKKKQVQKISSYRLRSLKLELEAEFYQGLYYKNYLILLKNELKFNDTLKKQVRLKRKQGLVGNADILEIDMRNATLKKKILENEEQYKHTLDTIRKIVFVGHDYEIELSGELPHKHYDISEKSLMRNMNSKNISLATAVNELEISNFKNRSASAIKLPEINLKGRVGKMRIDDRFSNNKVEGLVGLYVDIPLFDREKTSQYEIEQSINERKKLKLEQVKITTEIDLAHSYEKLLNIHAQVDLAEENVKNAISYFKNVSSEYNRGVKNSIDLVSARDKLTEFRQDLLMAKRDYLLTKIKLEKVSGTIIN